VFWGTRHENLLKKKWDPGNVKRGGCRKKTEVSRKKERRGLRGYKGRGSGGRKKTRLARSDEWLAIDRGDTKKGLRKRTVGSHEIVVKLQSGGACKRGKKNTVHVGDLTWGARGRLMGSEIRIVGRD